MPKKPRQAPSPTPYGITEAGYPHWGTLVNHPEIALQAHRDFLHDGPFEACGPVALDSWSTKYASIQKSQELKGRK